MSDRSLLPFHDWLVELRRDLHQHPELAFKEEKTAARIGDVLRQLGIPFQSGIACTGIVAAIDSERPGPTLALRADMDALPLNEKTEVPYRSKIPGVMHACGHDGHVTVALGTARLLLERGWKDNGAGKVLLIFQPAEESGGGAQAMLQSGVLDGESVAAVFSGHMHPELPAGQIGLVAGVCNAASDSIKITITGRGGHGAHPHLCNDPIVAGAMLVSQMQTVISRSISPLDSAVITIGKFHAGTARNVIPEEAVLEGTVRTLDPEVRKTVAKRLEELVGGLETGQGVSCDYVWNSGYPLLVNDPALAQYVTRICNGFPGPDNVHMERPRMGAEDFAFFARRWPGMLIRLGCRKPGTEFVHGLHSPWFDLDETALDVGVRTFADLIEKYSEL